MTNVMHKFIYLLLPYIFQAFFKPMFMRHMYKFSISSSLLGMVSAPGPLEDGLKESPKHVRQK
jgi:hypothetical protein